MKLERYRSRRNFRKTPEPGGARKPAKGATDRPRFVIQEHRASSHHFDFRLEADGVLKSWAVPKGPSTDPREKRLAVPTEDHPLEYADFEGVIPEGEYGAGPVIVWDAGAYRNLKTDGEGNEVPVSRQVEDGHVTVWLDGRKVHGGWSLRRIARGRDERWLLVKMKDQGADARRRPVRTQRESVLSGRTLEEVAREDGEDGGGRA